MAALAQCEQLLPRLIVLDLAMPRLDGIGVLAELKRRGWQERVAVLVVTARVNACAEAIAKGASDCLEKPFDLDDLEERVARLMLTERVVCRDSGY